MFLPFLAVFLGIMGYRQSWAILLVMCILCSSCGLPQGAQGTVGVNWGTQVSHPLSHPTVVQILKANNIQKVKLFDADNSVLQALANSGIDVMVGIPNEMLISMADPAQADLWVQDNVVRYKPTGTSLRYVAVGNEPFNSGYNETYSAFAYPAIKNIQLAINDANLGDQVKVTIPLNANNILSAVWAPSQALFRDDIADEVSQIAAFLAQNNCPFSININPFLSVYGNSNHPVDYVLFDSLKSPVVDGLYSYYNVFDATYDSLVVALSKVGYSDMGIIVGAIGWPTDGDVSANASNAERFNQGLINHVMNGMGTPRRPNATIDIYLLSLIDEDLKDIGSGNFERHWGIFKYDGQAKYSLSLSAGVNGGTLVEASGVQYLRQQWCVLDTSIVDTSTLPDSISYACKNADCTALGFGCSCYSYLNASGNASYAFNSFFQMQNQDAGACSFNGLGRIVTDNPSNSTCEFIIQLAYGSYASMSAQSGWKQYFLVVIVVGMVVV